jgi:hypothetical protein
MIRRQLGNQFLLTRQHDHALLAGRLAESFGNEQFAPPSPGTQTIRAIALHDAGWPLHDDHPMLSEKGLPLDVFEISLSMAIPIWKAAADRAADEHPYTQLLISLHVLGLSGFSARHVHTRQEVFELNKFQHREIERQVDLRRQLGLSVDIPLQLGLAMTNGIEEEDRLRRNHLILQAMDRISLALCCTQVLFPSIEGIIPELGGSPVTLNFVRTSDTSLRVEPWPFLAPAISLQLPQLPLAARAFASVEEFREAYAAAADEIHTLKVHS